MKNLLKCRQNKWSEFGKDFSVKIRKNTVFLMVFNVLKMRKNTQEFSNIGFCNPTKNEQNAKQRKTKNG